MANPLLTYLFIFWETSANSDPMRPCIELVCAQPLMHSQGKRGIQQGGMETGSEDRGWRGRTSGTIAGVLLAAARLAQVAGNRHTRGRRPPPARRVEVHVRDGRAEDGLERRLLGLPVDNGRAAPAPPPAPPCQPPTSGAVHTYTHTARATVAAGRTFRDAHRTPNNSVQHRAHDLHCLLHGRYGTGVSLGCTLRLSYSIGELQGRCIWDVSGEKGGGI